MSGTRPEAFDPSVELPAKSTYTGMEIVVNRSIATLLVTGKPVVTATLYGGGLSPGFEPRWNIENPLKKIENVWAEGREYIQKEVIALFAYASDLAGRRLSSALDTALKSGVLIASGIIVSDPLADRQDIPSDRVGKFRLDMGNNLAFFNVTKAPVLSNIEIRWGLPTKDRSGGQSLEQAVAPLIEKMWRLINRGEAKSLWAAACIVGEKAQGNGNLESKATRLCKRYRRQYSARSRN